VDADIRDRKIEKLYVKNPLMLLKRLDRLFPVLFTSDQHYYVTDMIKMDALFAMAEMCYQQATIMARPRGWIWVRDSWLLVMWMHRGLLTLENSSCPDLESTA
jgi:hypothetical protein